MLEQGWDRPSWSERHTPAGVRANSRAYSIRRWGFAKNEFHYPASAVSRVEILNFEDGETRTIYPRWMWWKHR